MTTTDRTRVRGLAPWQPRTGSLALLEQVAAVLDEYSDHLPLTGRQIFYRLVAAYGYAKDERVDKRLGELLNRARRAGRIPFEAIADDGSVAREPYAWEGIDAFWDAVTDGAGEFQLDRQMGQPSRLWMVVEAPGLIPQLERVGATFGVGVTSLGTCDGLGVKHALAQLLAGWPVGEVLYIGDHDPSDDHLFSALAEDVRTLCRDLGHEGDVRFTRLAVAPAQIDGLGLPTAPAKPTDCRRFDGDGTVQAEAIPPDVLADLVREAIEARQDANIRTAVLATEKRAKAQLLTQLRKLKA